MMQKQRSPYTGGGFNLQQLKATTFGKNESLTAMPFLVQLAHHVQQRPPRLSTLLTGKISDTIEHGEHYRGLHSASTRSYIGSYEGEMPLLSLGQNGNSNPSLADDSLRMDRVADNMDHMDHMDDECYNHMDNSNHNMDLDNVDDMGHMDGMSEMDNMRRMDDLEPLDNMDHMNNMSHLSMDDLADHLMDIDTDMDNEPAVHDHMDDNMEGISHAGHLGSLESPSLHGEKPSPSETDSETEYCEYLKSLDTEPQTRVRRIFEYLKFGMSPGEQERMEAAVQDCCEKSLFSHILLVLQLLAIFIVGVVKHGFSMSLNLSQVSFQLRRSKFQLRNILRQLLWRTVNFKGNDMVFFFGMVFITPWLFCMSLIGLIACLAYHLKESLSSLISQMLN